MSVSCTAAFSVACTATAVPVVILEMLTVIPSAGSGCRLQIATVGAIARAIGAAMSVRYCGTTSPANAEVATSRRSYPASSSTRAST